MTFFISFFIAHVTKIIKKNINYRIHIITFYTSESANDFHKDLGKKEKLLKVEEHQVSSKDTWYRVTMGGFKSREAALHKVNSLIKKGVIKMPREKK